METFFFNPEKPFLWCQVTAPPERFLFGKEDLKKFLLFILFTVLTSLWGSSQTVVVNYDFGSSNTACTSTPATASNISCSFSTSMACVGNRSGTAVSTPTSFATNSTAGNCIAFKSSSGGFSNDYFQFQLSGSMLNQYAGFKLFYSYFVDNSVGTLTLQYSTNGSSWTTFSTNSTTVNTWVSKTEDLSGVTALNLQSSIYFRIGIPSNSGGANKFVDIDNFQVYSNCLAPQLASLPSTLSQCVATSASMSVTVNSGNSPFTYQWKKNGSSISGATSNAYTISSLALADSGNYTVSVSNSCATTTSTTEVLTVNPLPTITLSSTASNVCFSNSSQNTTLSYSATTQSPTTYALTWNAAANTAGLVNAGTTSLPASPISVAVAANVAANTYTGSVVVTNANGCTSASNSFTLTVLGSVTNNSISSSQTICLNTVPTPLTGTSPAGGNGSFAYLWESSTTSASGGFSTASGTSNTQNHSPPALSQNTWYRRTVTSGACSNVSSTVLISMYATNQWIGGSSGDWNTAGNWCGGVPVSSTNVSIPANTTVYIQTANAVANAVTIAATGSLVMSGSYNLSITAGGTFSNSGSYTASGTGSVIFLGSGTISGTVSFKNIDSYGALNFGSASTVTGNFTLQPGGSVSANAPTFSCPSSTLIYNTGGTFSRGAEWCSTSSGNGYPANVTIQNNTVLNFAASAQGYICNDLNIASGASLRQDYSGGSASLRVGRNVTISGTLALGSSNGGDIYVGGSWTRNTGGTFTHNDRKVTFDGPANFSGNGTNMSTITAPSSTAKDNEGGFGGEKFAQLWVGKTNATDSVVLLSNITVTKELGLTKGTFSLRNSNVTLVSNSTRTADVAPVTTVANVNLRYGGSGRFVVQRFIQNPTAVRSWRLLTAPLETTTAPTLNEALQEGVVNPDKNSPNANGGIYNPWPAYGTHITGPGGTYSLANGFDQGTNSSSILYANAGITSWLSPSSTTDTKISDRQGWMLFVRGDRSFVIGNQYTPAQNTTLEPKGKINVGDVSVPVSATKQVIGNPYAAAISLLNVSVASTTGANCNYYMWDPKYFTSYTQPGKWVTFSGTGSSFVQTTSASAYPSNGTIESGQAFVIDAPSAGNITFHESDKQALTSSLVGIANRPLGLADFALFRSDIYVENNGDYILTDGVLNIFDTGYDNAATTADAKKLVSFNTKESLSILRDSAVLAIEKRRPVQSADTIFYNLSRFNELSYRFRFEAENFNPAIKAYLEDQFTGMRFPVSIAGATAVDFTITSNPLSKAADRFRVVFKADLGAVLPVTFISVTAARKRDKIAVQWNVADELNVKLYEVQKSYNGIHFETAALVAATNTYTGTHGYKWLDEQVAQVANYYRIVSIGADGKRVNSKVVMALMDNSDGTITVYPNPVSDGDIRLHFANMEKGIYTVSLLNEAGQLVLKTEMDYTGGDQIRIIDAGTKIKKGIYQLQIIQPSCVKIITTIIVN